MGFLPDVGTFQSPGRLDAKGVVGPDLRHIVADNQKKDADADGDHPVDADRPAHNGSVGNPDEGGKEQNDKDAENIIGLLVLFIAGFARIDSGNQKKQQEQDERDCGKCQRDISAAETVCLSGCVPMDGNRIRHLREQKTLSNQ